MSFPKEFLEELRHRVPLHDVISRRVSLTRKGREFTGLCPFHSEKTPSFTVNEVKGFYHCFGCGAHGDVVTFEMQQGLSFLEAVEKLAQEAGLTVPRTTPEQRHQAEVEKDQRQVLELATQFFERQLRQDKGRGALTYLRQRGLTDETIARFRLGYAPAGGELLTFAKEAQISPAHLVSVGLLRPSTMANPSGPDYYSYFRNRVIFPITDLKGRPIAFGGRTLSDEEPKYLNSPETDLFHKGDTLYGLAHSREKAFETSTIILCEGYMDVISLHQNGFDTAVAPLGTALTETQMLRCWRFAPEPLLCFDGDPAGQRAAQRAATRALPLLKPGQSLRFVFIPDRLDPDDYIKFHGQVAFGELLKQAVPLDHFLWEGLLRDRPLDTPEKKAALEKDAASLTAQIKDPTVQTYYRQGVKDKLWRLWRDHPRQGQSFATVAHLPFLVGAEDQKLLAAYILSFPHILEPELEKLPLMTFQPGGLAPLIELMGEALLEHPEHTSETLEALLNSRGQGPLLETLQTQREMIQTKSRRNKNILLEFQHFLTALHKKSLEAELQAISQQITPALASTLWQKQQLLQAELTRLREEESLLE